VPYLSIEEAAALSDDVRSLSRVDAWIIDYFSPEAPPLGRPAPLPWKLRLLSRLFGWMAPADRRARVGQFTGYVPPLAPRR
jgi:hypothetical protein